MTNLNIKTLNELLNKDYPPQEWLVDRIIPEEGIVLMSAAPASFKTWLAMAISGKVASGESLFGQFTTQQTGVLFLDEESGERQLNGHFKALGVGKDLPIYYMSYADRKLDKEYTEQLIDFCKEKEVGLVVLDSLTRFHNADENSAPEMSKVFEQFSKFKNAGITCLILHHNRKSNGVGSTADAMRGSSDILAACDLHITLSRQGNNISVLQTKNRLDEELVPFKARFVKNGERSEWQFVEYATTAEDKRDFLKNNIVQCITDNPGLNQKQILANLRADDVDISEKKLRELLRELVLDRYIYTVAGDRTEKLYFIVEDDDGRTAE